MRFMQSFKRYGNKLAVAVPLSAFGVSAHAAIPDGVKNAIEQAGADLITVGGYILVAIGGLFAIRLIMRVLN